MSIDAGLMIKKARKEMGLSQKEAARRAGITASLLSQIENKKTNVSLSTLEKLGKALDLPVTYFITAADHEKTAEGAPQNTAKREQPALQQLYDPVARKGLRPSIFLSGSETQLELLTPRVNRKFGVYKKTLECNQTFDGLDYFEPSEQLLYVSAGVLKVELNSGEYYLHPGYSIHFDQDNRLKKVTAVSANEPAVFVLFSSPPIY